MNPVGVQEGTGEFVVVLWVDEKKKKIGTAQQVPISQRVIEELGGVTVEIRPLVDYILPLAAWHCEKSNFTASTDIDLLFHLLSTTGLSSS